MNDSELIEEARRVNHDLARNALGERVPIIDMLADRVQDLAALRAEWEAEQGEVLTGEIRAVEFDDGKPRDPDECGLEDCACPEHNYPPRREGTCITVRLDGGFDGAGSWRVAIRRVPVEQGGE